MSSAKASEFHPFKWNYSHQFYIIHNSVLLPLVTMGNKGSTSAKAVYKKSLLLFTRWGSDELRDMYHRSTRELGNSFALRRFEFDFLLGTELVGFLLARELFETVFDIEDKKNVDKFEILCLICLLSNLSNKEKVEYLFDLFNFNNKGYLLQSELILLFVSVINGALKGDKLITTASINTLKSLAMYALNKYGQPEDPMSIRKPQLVSFVSETKDARAFLDAWRGHTGKILLAANELWRDPNFPANILSIAPSEEWLTIGLPPNNFVNWMRIHEVLPKIGEGKFLFTHSTNILKNVDRRVEYGGVGVLGEGYLVDGFLADKWILNAVALLTSRPKLLFGCFAATDQESIGRYCCKLFEGIGWRSVFVDDRIPCGPDGVALFGKSVDSSEYFVMIFEKALAKYLGSYGHLAICGQRGDSVLMGIRYMTGGHVMTYHVEAFDWKTIDLDCVRENGVKLIDKLFAEGSLVSFGISEVKLTHRFSLGKLPSNRLQHGLLFPVVGVEYRSDNYKYFILRDAWGVLTDRCKLSADETYGVCRTFELRVEDIPILFDTAIVSRFPDLLRPEIEALKLKQWHTEYVSNITTGPKQPAVFILDVVDHEIPPKRVDKSLVPSLSSLKKKDEISRKKGLEKKSSKSTDDKSGSSMDGKAGENQSLDSSKRIRHRNIKLQNWGKKLIGTEDDFVDIALTLNTSCEWNIAGDPKHGACTRLAVIPSLETRYRLRVRSIVAKNMKLRQERLAKKSKEETEKIFAALANTDSLTEDPTPNVDKQESGASDNSTTIKRVEADDSASFDSNFAKETYDVVFGEESCWMSRTLKLLPGRYYIFADISFKPCTYAELMKQSTPTDVSSLPWFEEKNMHDHVIHLQLSSQGRFNVTRSEESVTIPRNNVDLSKILVSPQSWPFLSQRQVDVCSKQLHEMLMRFSNETILNEMRFNDIVRDSQSVQSAITETQSTLKTLK